MSAPPLTGLVLSGGGARAAYQVGVLSALMRIRRESARSDFDPSNPFQIISGTSAGAINGTALACQADDFAGAVEQLVHVWRHFKAGQVYRSDSLGVMGNGARWLTMLSLGWALARVQPRSLLDNTPMQGLLERMVPMARLPSMLARRHLRAVAVSASSYTQGDHHTFYQSAVPVSPWVRSQRVAVQTQLVHELLLASAAIPFVFPAVRLLHHAEGEWFGDGSMRQGAPLSPAIHLGADRLLVIGAGRMHEPKAQRRSVTQYPTLGHVAGHAMSSIFLDALAVDVERLQRINRTLAALPPEVRHHHPLREVQLLVIAPSQRLDDLAAQHIDALPKPMRLLLRALGVQQGDGQGAALASYLLFEGPYTQALIALGEADTERQRSQVCEFFGWTPVHALP